MLVLRSTHEALQAQHLATEQKLAQAQQCLHSQTQKADRLDQEKRELSARLQQSKAENIQQSIRCDQLERQIATQSALIQAWQQGPSVFLRFGRKNLRFDDIRWYQTDEEGFVDKISVPDVQFGYGAEALRIRGSDLDAAITALFKGPALAADSEEN